MAGWRGSRLRRGGIMCVLCSRLVGVVGGEGVCESVPSQ